MEAPYPTDTRAKGWRFELDYERIRQSDTWALAAPELRPWLLMLWMTAWEQTPCGSLPNNEELVAAKIGMPLESFTSVKRVLLRGWKAADDGRLYHPTLTERVIEMIERRQKCAGRVSRHRAGKHASNDDVTRYAGDTNPLVMTPEQEPEPIKEKARRGSRLPADWALPKAWEEWGVSELGLSENAVLLEGEKFRDWWIAKPGQGGVKLDWEATWRNWLRKAVEFHAPKLNGVTPRTDGIPTMSVADALGFQP